MSTAPRWLTHDEGTFMVSPRLYRDEEWVARFLDGVDARLAHRDGGSVRLEVARPATLAVAKDGLVVTVVPATYRDVLLFHAGLHPEVDRLVDLAVRRAAEACARRGWAPAGALARHGREVLLTDPSVLLDRSVVAGLATLAVAVPVPLGVSGIVVVGQPPTQVVVSLRSDEVAVNPGCLAPPVDGGVVPAAGGSVEPRADLAREARDELPGVTGRWEPMGVLLPSPAPLRLGGRPLRRAGVNIVYRTVVDVGADALAAAAPTGFETAGGVVVEVRSDERGGLPPPRLDHGPVDASLRSMAWSEVLAAALHRLGVAGLRLDVDRPTAVPPTERKGRPVTVAGNPPPRDTAIRWEELTLEDSWADELLLRHPRLAWFLARDRLADTAESGDADAVLDHVLDAVREFELTRRHSLVRAVDEARLFEAVVYRVSRWLFANETDPAVEAHGWFPVDDLAGGGAVVGERYRARVESAIGSKDGPERDAARDRMHDRLRELELEEALVAFSEVGWRARLLCFCCALRAVEAKERPEAANLALDETYRRGVGGDAIAQFFRARALLTNPVASSSQAQVGIEFVRSALDHYPRNAGMHHTQALFLLRQSNTTDIEDVARAVLGLARVSVDAALRSEPDFPVFYATRARIRYRQDDRPGAVVDLRSAIELARYGEAGRADRGQVRGWMNLLDTWDQQPLGEIYRRGAPA